MTELFQSHLLVSNVPFLREKIYYYQCFFSKKQDRTTKVGKTIWATRWFDMCEWGGQEVAF